MYQVFKLKQYQVHIEYIDYVLTLFMITKLCKCACDVTACFSSDPYVEIFDQVLLPDHSLVENTVIRLRCMTGRVDCCTSANTEWYLPSGAAVSSATTASYGVDSNRGAIELRLRGVQSHSCRESTGVHCLSLTLLPTLHPSPTMLASTALGKVNALHIL